jgi:hypothetical protein
MALPPNRRVWLAGLGRRAANQALGRRGPTRRPPILSAPRLPVRECPQGVAERGERRAHRGRCGRGRARFPRDVRVGVGRLAFLGRCPPSAPRLIADGDLLDRIWHLPSICARATIRRFTQTADRHHIALTNRMIGADRPNPRPSWRICQRDVACASREPRSATRRFSLQRYDQLAHKAKTTPIANPARR